MLSFYDLLMLVVFAGAILFGLWKGLAWQIASLAAVFVSYFVALVFRGQVAVWIPADPPWNQFIAMAVLYLGCSLAIWLAFGAVRRNIARMQLKEFDRQAGALLGAVKGALLCMVITMFAVTIPGDGARRQVIQSRSGNFIASAISRLSAVVPKELHEVLQPHFNRFHERFAEPLPPQAPGESGGWVFGLPGSVQPNGNSIPVTGQFNWPVIPATSSGQNGIRVNINGEDLLNRGLEAIRDGLGGTPGGTTPAGPAGSPWTTNR